MTPCRGAMPTPDSIYRIIVAIVFIVPIVTIATIATIFTIVTIVTITPPPSIPFLWIGKEFSFFLFVAKLSLC